MIGNKIILFIDSMICFIAFLFKAIDLGDLLIILMLSIGFMSILDKRD